MKGTVDRKTVQFTPWIFVCCCCFTIRTDTVWINDYATFWCVRKEENDVECYSFNGPSLMGPTLKPL